MRQSTMHPIDCIAYAKTLPDKHFFLTIADPPYFSGPERREYYGRKVSPIGVHRVYEKSDAWNLPTQEDFNELQRVSQNLVVWGVNYFDYSFGPGRIVWDKCNGTSSFSDCEIAYCSMWNSVWMFRFMWNGMLQGKSMREGHIMQGNKQKNEQRIHPTQKPVALYDWTFLACKVPEGATVFDPYAGSQSMRIAAYEAGLDYTGCEMDKSMYEKGCARFARHVIKQTAFGDADLRKEKKHMTQTQEKCCAAIAQQMKSYRDGELESGVGEMLHAFVCANDHDAELILQDLTNQEMNLSAAGKKLYEYAKSNKKGSSYCLTPQVAEKLLRKFYGLSKGALDAGENMVQADSAPDIAPPMQAAQAPEPKRGGRIDLADFL